MQKRLLIVSLASFLLCAESVTLAASEMEMTAIEQSDTQVTITVSQSVAVVSGAQGETLEVVSLTGKKLMTVKIDSPVQRVELNVPKGCYILKVGKVVRKVSIH